MYSLSHLHSPQDFFPEIILHWMSFYSLGEFVHRHFRLGLDRLCHTLAFRQRPLMVGESFLHMGIHVQAKSSRSR